MVLKINNFGDILISRPAGKEAFLMAKAYVFKELASKDDIILDFSEIKVLTPSWVDEFISGIKSEYKNSIQYINTENPSVKASLKTVLSEQ
ncbi:STAS-like domain-containing protein [Treponema primitia]|uniref:STAS-like domain-containing protein n=1 Tax=Treponema primitia TaxID=88058 RepID=UPI00397E958B